MIFLSEHGPRLMVASSATVLQFFLAAIPGIAISLAMGLMKLSNRWYLRWVAVTYIEIFRGTSLLVQLFWIFYVLPLFGIAIEKFTAGYVAVGMNIGAYGAELVRGGILAVPKGQGSCSCNQYEPGEAHVAHYSSASVGLHALPLGEFAD